MNLDEVLKEFANKKFLEIYKEVYCIKDMYRPVFLYIITHGFYKVISEEIANSTKEQGNSLLVKLLDFCEILSIRYDQSEKLKPYEFMDTIKESGELTTLLKDFLKK